QALTITVDADGHRFKQGRRGMAVHLHVVGLVRATPGVGDGGRPSGIVAEQQQAFTGTVQAPDGRDPAEVGAVEAAIDGVATALVAGAGDQASRFVEHQVARSRCLRRYAVDCDAGAFNVHRPLGVAYHAAVDG